MDVFLNHIHDMKAAAVKSAHRVFDLLEFFAEWRKPATVNEISQSLGFPQSSTSVLLRSLKECGFFDHDARTGMYVPNIRLALATAWIEEQLYTEQSLLRLMERVLAQTGHTVMIGKRQGMQVRYLHVLQATRAGSFTSKSGLLRPLFRSATGKMLISTLTEREVAKLLRQANTLDAPIGEPPQLEQVLMERKRTLVDGYAVSWGTSVPGAAAMAVLLPVPRGHEPMTLSLGGPMQEIEQEKDNLLQMLQSSISIFRQAAGSR